MKSFIQILFFFFIYVGLYSQSKANYLVFTFHSECKTKGHGLDQKSDDYMWAIPADSCLKQLDLRKLKPLLIVDRITDFSDGDLYPDDIYPVNEYPKTDSILFCLYQNRRLVQKTKQKIKEPLDRTIFREVFLVPIVAKCQKVTVGYQNRIEVLELTETPEVWTEFWSNPDLTKVLLQDFFGVDFKVVFY